MARVLRLRVCLGFGSSFGCGFGLCLGVCLGLGCGFGFCFVSWSLGVLAVFAFVS